MVNNNTCVTNFCGYDFTRKWYTEIRRAGYASKCKNAIKRLLRRPGQVVTMAAQLPYNSFCGTLHVGLLGAEAFFQDTSYRHVCGIVVDHHVVP